MTLLGSNRLGSRLGSRLLLLLVTAVVVRGLIYLHLGGSLLLCWSWRCLCGWCFVFGRVIIRAGLVLFRLLLVSVDSRLGLPLLGSGLLVVLHDVSQTR